MTSQNFDHTSILRFLEARFSVKAPLISSCCRAVNFAPPNDATLATLAGRRSKVDADALPDFERRFAGRVETGRDGLSDPAMTAARGAAPPPPVPRTLVESASPWRVRVAGGPAWQQTRAAVAFPRSHAFVRVSTEWMAQELDMSR